MPQFFSLFVMVLLACSSGPSEVVDDAIQPQVDQDANSYYQKMLKQYPESEYSRAYFASGCFWCVEAIFESVIGVEEAISGYAGGEEKNPTYRDVSAGKTGHTESVEVIYRSDVVSYETLLEVYYGSHNPTTVNGQHPDYGRQYRSAIFFQTDDEKALALKAKENESSKHSDPVATEIVAHERFWCAEVYHQDYERNNPDNSYVQNVSIPRLKRFQSAFPHLLKSN